MKLRIPRRIKVEEDTSESESENFPAESTSAAEEPEDKAQAASPKTSLVSPTALVQCFLQIVKSNPRAFKSK